MTYAIAGNLTVDTIQRHFEAVAALLSPTGSDEKIDPETLEVDLSDLGQFDLAGLQLLYSVEKECEKSGVTLSLVGRENVARIGNMIAFCGLTPIERQGTP